MKKTYSADEIIKILKRNGWIQVKIQSGTSHYQFKHPSRKGKVTVPYHKGKDLRIHEIKSIEKQSGLEL